MAKKKQEIEEFLKKNREKIESSELIIFGVAELGYDEGIKRSLIKTINSIIRTRNWYIIKFEVMN